MPDHHEMLLALSERDVRFGKRRVTKMYAQINDLRQAIQRGDMDAIQAAWDVVEEHIDFAYQMAVEGPHDA